MADAFYFYKSFIKESVRHLFFMEKKNGNWTIKETKKIFENDFFKVYEDDVIKPEGEPGNFATVHLVPGACVLAIDDEDFVYLTEQFRYVVGRNSIEVVAGSIEDETPLEAAKRELKEEVGATAEEMTEIGVVQLDTSMIKNEVSFFVARKLSFDKPDRDATEEMKTVKIKFREAVGKVLSGEIDHALSRALILQAWAQSGNKL
jgi:8-oxo-dGTP pyrophosphatase MutT (NUDIX family)